MVRRYNEILRELRKRAGYSITQVAGRLAEEGIRATNTQISRWENGYNNPNLEQFLGLCRAYGTPDLYRAYVLQNLDELPADLNRNGYLLLSRFRELLLGSGWFHAAPETEKQPQEIPVLPAPPKAEHTIVIVPLRERLEAELLRLEAQQLPAEQPEEPSNIVPFGRILPGDEDEEEEETNEFLIPIYDMPASAGTGTLIESSDTHMIPVPEYVPSDVSFAALVQGNSMEPLIFDGEVLYIRSQETLEDGEVGVMSLNDMTYVKQFRTAANGDWLVSINPSYAPIRILESDNLLIHGKVVYPRIPRSAIETPAQLMEDPEM